MYERTGYLLKRPELFHPKTRLSTILQNPRQTVDDYGNNNTLVNPENIKNQKQILALHKTHHCITRNLIGRFKCTVGVVLKKFSNLIGRNKKVRIFQKKKIWLAQTKD